MAKIWGPALAAISLLAVGHLAAQTPPAAADLATRIQAHYDTVHDFRAAFTDTYTSATLGQKTVGRGDVRIKKPNRMYWTYATPDKKIYVADGSQIFDFDPNPAAPQCTVSALPSGDQLPQGILFLAGRGNLVRDFTSTVPAAQPPNAWRLDLVPKILQNDFVALSIVADRATLTLQSFITTDREGNTQRFDFTNLKENVGLRDTEFTFSPPHGVRCEAPSF